MENVISFCCKAPVETAPEDSDYAYVCSKCKQECLGVRPDKHYSYVKDDGK